MVWKTAKLADLCSYSNGLWKGKKPPFIEVGVIRNTNFRSDGSLDDSDIAYLEVEEKQFKTRQLAYGDIILEKSGGGPKQPVGRVVIFDKQDGLYSFSNFTSALRVIDQRVLLPEFLHKYLYWLYLDDITEGMQSHSTGIRNLDFNSYKLIEVPLPPLPEQRRIVAILDEAFAAIDQARANAERNKANARELFDSYLNAIFSNPSPDWEVRRLDAIATILNGFAFKSTDFSSKPGVNCIKITNVGVGEFVCDSGNYLPFDFAEKYEAVTVKKGSIVIALTRTIISGGLKVAIVPEEYGGALLNQRVAAIEPNPALAKDAYLHSYLSTQLVVDYVQERVNTLMQPNLSITDLRCMPVPLPSIDEQEQISKKLSALHPDAQALKAIYQQKVDSLDELKQSILYQAFNGQLTQSPDNLLEAVAG